MALNSIIVTGVGILLFGFTVWLRKQYVERTIHL